MRFGFFPKREEDVNNILRFITVLFILAVLPLSVILTQRETSITEQAKEANESRESAFRSLKLDNAKTEFLYPHPSGVGWVKSNDSVPNHFGDDDIHVGYWSDDEYIGLLQFDLSSLPENAKVIGVQLSLIGKSAARLGEGGEWKMQLLESTIDESFSQKGFTGFKKAKVLATLSPVLKSVDLRVQEETSFTLNDEEVKLVKDRFNTSKKVSFRIIGPSLDQEQLQNLLGKKQEFNLFTWESGYGEGTFKIKPVLEILYTL